MVFTIDRKYDSSDEYFKRMNFSFVMAASLKKFTRLNGCMEATCHEAIMFSGFRGRRIPLGVFGHVMRYSDTALSSQALCYLAGYKLSSPYVITLNTQINTEAPGAPVKPPLPVCNLAIDDAV
jgi:hypothetical protein